MSQRRGLLIGVSAIGLAVLIFLGSLLQLALTVETAWAQSSVRPPANAVTNAPMQPGVGRVPDAVAPPDSAATGQLDILGPNSDATLWGEARRGESFTVSIPDKKAATLMQSYGMTWQQIRGPDGRLGEWVSNGLIVTMIAILIFYVLRGRIRIEHGESGRLIRRFNGVERFGHWLLAVSFILLALSGLNMLYGRDLMIPFYEQLSELFSASDLSPEEARELAEKEARAIFATTAAAGKWLHNNIAWAFMLSLVLIFVTWVVHNIPALIDLQWLAQGGGLFSEGVHPPSRKFNAGQKLIFWSVVLLGASVSASGVSLLFPYEVPLFAKTFAMLHGLGVESLFGVPMAVTPTAVEEMQYAQIWHSVVALAMMMIIIGHIYIGSLGMQGAFAAMGTGMVDRNWAEEHHGLWVEEEDAKARAGGAATTPAE